MPKKRNPKEKEEYIVLSEGQLMWRKFLKHRVAVAAAIILIILYIVIIFSNHLTKKSVGTLNSMSYWHSV